MPEKRPSPLLESPPDASSSSDEEMEEVVEEEEEVKGENNEEDIEEDIEEEEEEDEEEEEEEEEEDGDDSRFTVKKHDVPTPQPKSSSVGEEEEDEEEEEESDSESGSDSDLPPETTKSTRAVNTVIDPTVKPLTSIPMDGNAKLKKSTTTTEKPPKPTVTPSKRPAKTTTDNKQEDSKRRKKSGGGGDGEESEKKSSNKLWSEDDEVVILKGMVSLMKRGLKPTSDMNVLLEQIKASIHFDVTKDQLLNKIRRLKQKYQANVKKEVTGEELQFQKAHDSKCYELSKKVWGEKDVAAAKVEGTAEASNGVVDSVKKEVKSRNRKPTNAAVVSPKSDAVVVSPKLDTVVVVSPQIKEVSTLAEQTPSLSSSPYFNEIIDFGKNSIAPPEGLKGFLAKEAMGLIGSSKAKALEEKWRKFQVAEAKLYLQRMDLVREQVKMVLDAVGSPEE